VRLRDLAAERQPDAGAGRLGREERHEQVGRIGESGALVAHADLDAAVDGGPGDVDLAVPVLLDRVDRVAQKVDQHLLDLVAVGLNRDVRASAHAYDTPVLEPRDALDQRPHGNRLAARRRQLRHASVRGHEATQRVGASADHHEAVAHVVRVPGREAIARDQSPERVRDRRDGRE
jgi:hypothetical protein